MCVVKVMARLNLISTMSHVRAHVKGGRVFRTDM